MFRSYDHLYDQLWLIECNTILITNKEFKNIYISLLEKPHFVVIPMYYAECCDMMGRTALNPDRSLAHELCVCTHTRCHIHAMSCLKYGQCFQFRESISNKFANELSAIVIYIFY
jgi:hypothetical protein